MRLTVLPGTLLAVFIALMGTALADGPAQVSVTASTDGAPHVGVCGSAGPTGRCVDVILPQPQCDLPDLTVIDQYTAYLDCETGGLIKL